MEIFQWNSKQKINKIKFIENFRQERNLFSTRIEIYFNLDALEFGEIVR